MAEFIVEADGGSRGNPGPAGYGAVVLDAATGETLAERAGFLGTVTNNVAEYRGLLAGLEAARELDPAASVHVRMDSKLVVEQMSGRWQIKHPDLRSLALRAASVLPASRVTYEWIPRARNKHADRLANEAMDAGLRGERWSPAESTADLDAAASALVSGPVPGPVSAPEPLPGPGSVPGPVPGPVSAPEPLPGPGSAPEPLPGPGAVPERVPGPVSVPAAVRAEADFRAARNVASTAPAPDLGPPATFVLLRHGETPLTLQKRFSGSGGSDPSLSAVGRHQAERVAAALAARGTVQAVVSSPLARCRQTAEIVAARLGLDVTVEDGLRETDFGAWEGLTFAEVRERHPEDMAAWLASPDAAPTGGGESFAAVTRRVAATRDALTAAHAGRTVLLVTHVTPIKTLVRLALDAPPEALFRMELSAASLSAVAYYADGNASVRLLNDTSHLR
ncbi:bifunctional RNase H/acid phosphatase [Streptomyces ruber]|uniref:Bifunctional RNase H/acid phosphatase n=2 Tax=Streptomyces TaxID=1883 RepID=A0A918BGD0_9ACTN|nr:bifunctional RNase H/acid phosphatase [Streptomyces ruber]GGQ64955.1 bifunctional RNase H/acid phosphatase [Streptomyces ruber]